MVDARKNLAEAADRAGISLKTLSEAAGKNHAYLQQFVKRGVPVKLPEEVRRAVAQMLDIDEAAIGYDLEHIRPKGEVDLEKRPANLVLMRSNASAPVPIDYPTARLPMLGTAVGGEDGRFVLNGSQIGDALCPPQLLGVPNAYGVFVNGTSMEPRYHPGEAVFVNPHLPVRQGDYVVVQVAGEFDGDDLAGFVKRFVSMNARELVLEQYQDRDLEEPGAIPGDLRSFRIARQRVVAVHKIVASGTA